MIRPGRDRTPRLHRADRCLLGGVSRLRPGRGWRGAGAARPRQLFRRGGWRALGGGAGGRVVGMVGTRPLQRRGLGDLPHVCRGGPRHRPRAAPADAAEAHARAAGAARLVLWTDTRFDAAHRFYEKHGYVRQGAIRILDDLSKSLEFRYAKPARGLVVEALDAAAAASAERRLARNPGACVMPGRACPSSRRWRWTRRGASGARWRGRCGGNARAAGGLAGGRAGRDRAARARHAAEPAAPGRCEKLLVDPAARGAGIGRALMQRIEQAAQRMAAPAAVPMPRATAEKLYRSLGWQEAGRFPVSPWTPTARPSTA